MLKKALASLLLAVMVGPAHAAATGNAAAGAEKTVACQGCHGPDGNSLAPIFPSLAGQKPNYIMKQLLDFQSGKRTNETMAPMAAGLTPQDLADIAAYYSAQKVTPAGSSADKAALDKGKSIYFGGIKKREIAACASCHGPLGAGNNPAKFPSVAGQQADYIAAQLEAFKSGARQNDMNKMMRLVSEQLTTQEMQALGAFLATMKP